MGYRFDVDPQEYFADRTVQWTRYGLSTEDIAGVRGAVTGMWSTGRGGWVPEWSRIADRYATAGDHYRAALAYGVAAFPAVVDDTRQEALSRQVEQYRLASAQFPTRFRRDIVDVPYGDGRTPVAVHVLSAPDAGPDAPVVLCSGGVDTWKMSQHPILVALAVGLSAHVVGFDHPGTGETTGIPLRPDSYEIMAGLIAFARGLTTGRVAHVGISFGGYFSAATGLRGDVDAAVVLGGPVRLAFREANFRRLMAGMPHVIGNAMGFPERPTAEQIIARAAAFDLDHLLAADRNCPMLVVNGDADRHVPIEDATVFTGRSATDVVVVPGGTHCAVNQLDRVLVTITDWLAGALRPAA